MDTYKEIVYKINTHELLNKNIKISYCFGDKFILDFSFDSNIYKSEIYIHNPDDIIAVINIVNLSYNYFTFILSKLDIEYHKIYYDIEIYYDNKLYVINVFNYRINVMNDDKSSVKTYLKFENMEQLDYILKTTFPKIYRPDLKNIKSAK